jgi:hypothetical protein
LIFCLRPGLFLVERQAVQQLLQDAAGFAGLDQVAVQRVEVLRVLAEGRGQAVPVSTSARMSLSRRVRRGWRCRARRCRRPAAAARRPHHGGQLAREDGDVLGLDRLAARVRRFLTLVTIMPWRRRLALTTASPPARISPRTILPLRSLPSHSKMKSLTFFAAAAPLSLRPLPTVDG